MNMQNVTLSGQKNISLESVKAKLVAGNQNQPLTPGLVARLEKALKKNLGKYLDEATTRQLLKDILDELAQAKTAVARSAKAERIGPRSNTVLRLTPANSSVPEPKPVKQKAPKPPRIPAGKVGEEARARRKAEREALRLAKSLLEEPDRRQAKKKAPAIKAEARPVDEGIPFRGELSQPIAKAPLEKAVRKVTKPPVKRKRKGVAIRQSSFICIECFTDAQRNALFARDSAFPEEDALDRKLREFEEAQAAERALHPVEEPQQAPQPKKTKKKRESKLLGVEQSAKQNKLNEEREWRLQQEAEAEAAAEQLQVEVPVAHVEAKRPRIKRGRTEEKEAERALAAEIRQEEASKPSKVRRHIKPRFVKVRASSPRPSAENPELHPWNQAVALKKAALQRDLRHLQVMEVFDAIPRERFLQRCFSRLYHTTEAMMQKKYFRLDLCEDNIILMHEIRDLADIDHERVMRELPSVNPLLTLATLVARVFRPA